MTSSLPSKINGTAFQNIIRKQPGRIINYAPITCIKGYPNWVLHSRIGTEIQEKGEKYGQVPITKFDLPQANRTINIAKI